MQSTTQTHTTTTSRLQFRVSIDYLKTVPGILKVVEMVLAIIAFGCASSVADRWSGWSGGSGYGWVSFVTISGFLQALIALLLHIILDSNWAVVHVGELILWAIWSVLLLIAGIVAAAMAHGYSTAGAAAAFTFFALAAWVIDTLFQLKDYRGGNFHSSHTTTTTTTTTTPYPENPHRYEGQPQY